MMLMLSSIMGNCFGSLSQRTSVSLQTSAMRTDHPTFSASNSRQVQFSAKRISLEHADAQQDKTKKRRSKQYDAIFKKVTLTPQQQEIAQQIQNIINARSVWRLKSFLSVLSQPYYETMANVKDRMPFHTPFTDLLLNLPQRTPWLLGHRWLLYRLQRTVKQTKDETTRQNAAMTLADLYFYALRPGGQLSERQTALRDRLLRQFDSLVLNPKTQPEARRAVQTALRNRMSEFRFLWNMMDAPTAKWKMLQAQDAAKVEQQLQRYLNATVPATPAAQAMTPAEQSILNQALTNDTPDQLRALARRTGDSPSVLEQLIPAWSRLHGPDNVQHQFQHYTLDEHSLQTWEHTRRSPHFQRLNPQQQRLLSWVALLHDISKRTGPENLRNVLSADMAHPIKGVDVVSDILKRAGFSQAEIELGKRVVEHHQILGNLSMAYPASNPPAAVFDRIAQALHTRETVLLIRPLTEGDIRSVLRDSALYTPEKSAHLDTLTAQILARLPK